MRCGNAGECLYQQLQVSWVAVKHLRLLTVALAEKCYNLKIQRADWKPVLHKVCAGKQSIKVLILLCRNCCTKVALWRGGTGDGRQNLEWIVLKCLPKLLVPDAAIMVKNRAVYCAHCQRSYYMLLICYCRQFKTLLCYAFRGHAF